MDCNIENKTKCLYEKCIKNLDLKSAKLGDEFYYDNLTFCLIDAVFSMGIRYKIVQNAITRYKNYISEKGFNFNEHKISDFKKIVDSFSCEENKKYLLVSENILTKNRTSPKNGILKTEACYRIAEIFINNHIETKEQFNSMSKNIKESVKEEISNVKGQSSGIMLEYLYMLAGDDDICKPDRHLHKFVETATGEQEDNSTIQNLMKNVTDILKKDFPNLTVRLLDYEIWKFQKNQNAAEQSAALFLIQ